MKQTISFLLVISLIFGPFSLALGESSTWTGSVRSGGTSFGSNEKEVLPSLPTPPTSAGPVFQEQYPGLLYQVHILGEVNKPGTYRVSASTRLSEALERAGGFLERGSERKIELRRQGGSRRVDLLSFRIFGNLDSNPYLLDNDVIFVPLKQKVVQIEGTIKRPGVYELRSERTLADLIKLVGGFTPGFSDNPTPIKVVRFSQGRKEIIDVENWREVRQEFLLENADVVVVPNFLTETKAFDYNLAKLPGDNKLFFPSYEERVFVLGGVAQPGPYPFSPYYGVRQYLTLAGGTTKLAKEKKIKVLTTDGKTLKAKVDTGINPGDTIVVPERYMAPESFATLVIGIASSVVGITSAIIVLTR